MDTTKTTFDVKEDCSDAHSCTTRLLARAAGELHGDNVRLFLRDVRETGGDPVSLLRRAFARLQQAGALCKGEVLQFEKVFALINEKSASSEQALASVCELRRALVDQHASPCALALAGIAENSMRTAVELEGPSAPKEAAKKKWWQILGADLAGAGTGAVTGAAAGGVGAVVGALAGAAVGTGTFLMKED